MVKKKYVQSKTKKSAPKIKKESKVEKKRRLLDEVQTKINEGLDKPISLNEVIIRLCESYQKSFQLSDEQKERLEEIEKITHRPQNHLLESILDMGMKYYASKFEKASKMSKKDLRNSTAAGSANIKIDTFVKKIMKKNDKATNPRDKVYINQTYLTKEQGSNRRAIQAYLEANKEMLEEHHQKHELNPRHNFSVNNYLKRMKEAHEREEA